MNEILQGTPEWHALRIGKVTASRVADVVAKTKSGWSAMRTNYMAELIAERLTGELAPSFISGPMAHGKDTEAEARAAYEFRTDAEVALAAFVDHPAIPMTGASPDGLIGDDGMLELKCPNTATHIETLLGDEIPGKYITQMQWQMACAGRQWCDFASFDPRLPESMRLFIKRVKRDNERIAELEQLVSAFLTELDGKVSALRGLYEQREAA